MRVRGSSWWKIAYDPRVLAGRAEWSYNDGKAVNHKRSDNLKSHFVRARYKILEKVQSYNH